MFNVRLFCSTSISCWLSQCERGLKAELVTTANKNLSPVTEKNGQIKDLADYYFWKNRIHDVCTYRIHKSIHGHGLCSLILQYQRRSTSCFLIDSFIKCYETEVNNAWLEHKLDHSLGTTCTGYSKKFAGSCHSIFVNEHVISIIFIGQYLALLNFSKFLKNLKDSNKNKIREKEPNEKIYLSDRHISPRKEMKMA